LIFHKVCGAGQSGFIGVYIAACERYGLGCQCGETKAFTAARFCPGSTQADKVAELAGMGLKPGKLISADGGSRYQGGTSRILLKGNLFGDVFIRWRFAKGC
jgi:hypothetical protein